MSRKVITAAAALLIVGGVATLSYFKIPSFKEQVDEFAKKFRDDMKHRENELIEALSSTEEEVKTAQETWAHRRTRGSQALNSTGDDVDF